MRVLQLTLGLLCFSCLDVWARADEYAYRQMWLDDGLNDLRRAKQKPNVGVAKNVILFLGDGMGMSTVTAARIFQGQKAGRTGEEGSLSFEEFPYVGLSKVYNVDAQNPDSGGTATAFLTGVKTISEVLGVDSKIRLGDCSSLPGTELEGMLEWSHAKGKSVGVISNTRITHASPAALWAKTPHRDWESDTDMIARNITGPCVDIARQLVDNNIDIRVILGGGRQKFLRKTDIDPETKQASSSGRSDDRNLIEDWLRKQGELNRSARYVWNASEFNDVDPSETDYLLGLFSESHMHYALDREQDVGGEPSLVEMTHKAIQILQKNPNGYFLYIEGGLIDKAHHQNWAKRAMAETVEFADAVTMATGMTNEKDTLTVVTADHSHVFTISGYSKRGNPILGLAGRPTLESYIISEDGKPLTTLGYANGPGSFSTETGALRPDPRQDDLEDKDYRQQATVPLVTETHAGEDVAIYARGPMSHLIHGVHEQSYIAHVMAYATCTGLYSEPSTCAMADVEEKKKEEEEKNPTCGGVDVRLNIVTTAVLCLYILW